MAKKTENLDTSSISELLVKEWADHYPQETVNQLQAKAQSLTYTINTTKEDHTKLTIAKSRLEALITPVPKLLSELSKALSARQEFIAEYGDLGVPLNPPPETIQSEILIMSKALTDYGEKVYKAYFSNLDAVAKTIVQLENLRNLYQDLATIPTVIRTNLLKTDPSRRKPIYRELYRLFKSVGDNYIFLANAPTIDNPLLASKIDPEEFKSLETAKRNAAKFAALLKNCR